jgi:hypothetical protein
VPGSKKTIDVWEAECNEGRGMDSMDDFVLSDGIASAIVWMSFLLYYYYYYCFF